MNINIINCTPHDIDIVDSEGNLIARHKAECLARVQQTTTLVGVAADGTPLYKSTYGEVVGLPEAFENNIYIVSSIVKAALPDRTDLVCPTGFVRNDKGTIIGATGLTF